MSALSPWTPSVLRRDRQAVMRDDINELFERKRGNDGCLSPIPLSPADYSDAVTNLFVPTKLTKNRHDVVLGLVETFIEGCQDVCLGLDGADADSFMCLLQEVALVRA